MTTIMIEHGSQKRRFSRDSVLVGHSHTPLGTVTYEYVCKKCGIEFGQAESIPTEDIQHYRCMIAKCDGDIEAKVLI